jgi:hypothetical protein
VCNITVFSVYEGGSRDIEEGWRKRKMYLTQRYFELRILKASCCNLQVIVQHMFVIHFDSSDSSKSDVCIVMFPNPKV